MNNTLLANTVDTFENIEKESSMPMDEELLQVEPLNQEDTQQEPSSQEASPHGTSDKPQSAVSQSKEPDGEQQKAEELAECEQKVRDCVRNGLDTVGKYLCAIHDGKLYAHRINPKTEESYTWEDYCTDVLKISVQYADRKIAAWKTREKVKPYIDEQDYDELPLTTAPWVEVSRRDKNEQVDVIKGLISKFKKENIPLGRMKASDVRDFQLNEVEQDDSTDDDVDDEEGSLDDSDAVSEEPMSLDQMADYVANGIPTDFTRLSPLNREELRKKLEDMLDENCKVQEHIKTALKELDNDAEQTTDQLAS